MRLSLLLLRGLAASVVATAFLPSCGGATEHHLTQVIVSIDTDLVVPGDVNKLHVTVTDSEGNKDELGGDHDLTAGDLPLTIGLRAASNDARNFTVDAVLRNADKPVLERKISAQFVPNENRFLPVTLCGSCRDLSCPASCGEQGCTKEDVAELDPWTGSQPARVTCQTCQAGVPLPPKSAFIASPMEWPHVCNPDNVLVKDDKVTGLDYSESDGANFNLSFGSIGGSLLPGCIGVDFTRVQPLDPIVVRARAVRDDTTACGPPDCVATEVNGHCKGCCEKCATNFNDGSTVTNLCAKGGSIIVFAGSQKGTYKEIGSKTLTNDLTDESFSVPEDSQFIVVCRSADGPAAADVAVDAIWSERPCP